MALLMMLMSTLIRQVPDGLLHRTLATANVGFSAFALAAPRLAGHSPNLYSNSQSRTLNLKSENLKH